MGIWGRSLVLGFMLVFAAVAQAVPYTIENYPLLERLQARGQGLSKETLDWMKKWKGMDIEDRANYHFLEISGSTSINLKVDKVDPTSDDGYKSRGSFVTRNSSANPNTEVAYFHMAAILGYDAVYRPAAPYILGPKATQDFKKLILATPFKGKHRLANKERILKAIDQKGILEGCMKAKKLKPNYEWDGLGLGTPKASHPLMQALQARQPKPSAEDTLTLAKGYTGRTLELAREYSVLLTLDAIFQQWDRYSGGNVVLMLDENGVAHFYATDNGGADMNSTTGWLTKNLNLFSRYDRQVVEELKSLYAFLQNPQNNYLGYTSAEEFVFELGLRTELSPATYATRLQRNIGLFLQRVQENEAKYGAAIYF